MTAFNKSKFAPALLCFLSFLLFHGLTSRTDFQSSDEAAARNAFHEVKDEWASAEYRQDVTATLAKRCVRNLK